MNHKLVFIGGLHRSGTSIFHRCLGDHPAVSAFSNTGVPEDEGQHLQDIFKPAKYYGGPGTFGFDANSYLTEESELATNENAEALFNTWSDYWDLTKPVLVEKSPPNLVRCRFFQSLYPNSYFIIVMRHPVAVSYATKKWSKTSLNSLIKHWLVCHQRFVHDKPALKRCLIINYEDFTRQPDKILKSIWKFIDVDDFSPDRDIRETVNEKYFSRWRELGGKSLAEKLYKNYLIKKYESRVQEFGYSLKSV